jgi:predicted AlkP superfamily pyrophosphatase or phosphodiesterase
MSCTSRVLFCLALGLALGACSPQEPTPPAGSPAASPVPRVPPENTPRLVLHLVIDQLAYDTLERYRPFLTGGLAQLLAESTVFTDAHHAHAMTATAPGHATLATGCHPKTHGVIGNGWYDREAGEAMAAVDDPEFGASPHRMRCTTLGDWLKEAYPESKVYGASGKDRGAIFSAGKNADGAFWYDRKDGSFTSSSYYPQAEAPWLQAFKATRPADRWFGEYWEPLPETLAAVPESGVVDLDRGVFPYSFPHSLGSSALAPDSSFYGTLRSTPFVDTLLVDFAEVLLDAEALGQDAYPDLLALSFSAMDTVGHGFGPHSPEALDTLLRLDRELARLLTLIDEKVGLDATVISLSADHGVMPLPEYLAQYGDGILTGHRLDGADVTCIQGLYGPLRERFGDFSAYIEEEYIDRAGMTDAGIDPVAFLEAVDELLLECPVVEAVWTWDELNALSAPGAMATMRFAAGAPLLLYLNSFDPERSPDFQAQLVFGTQPREGSGATHGSPYPYDTHVPWLLRLPGGEGRVVGERVETVDVAPTLASVLGMAAPSGDGVVRLPIPMEK